MPEAVRASMNLRRVVDALLYVVKTGCQWRQLPTNFPPWLSVHQQFRAWRDDGTWERVSKSCASRAARQADETPHPAWRLSIRSRPRRR